MAYEVRLSGVRAAGRVALVDDEDYGLVMKYRWYVQEKIEPGRRPYGPYARASFRREGKHFMPLMHTLITGYSLVDHINHNGLDNQRSNLRAATDQESARNQRPWANGTSSYMAVSWKKKHKKWEAQVTISGYCSYLGLCTSEAEPALSYD